MKKFLTMLLAAAMFFTLAACGTTANPTENDTQNNGQDLTPVEAPQITTLYDEDFDYTDGVGNGGHYTYRVPQIEADTQGAEAINKGYRRHIRAHRRRRKGECFREGKPVLPLRCMGNISV